MQLDGSARLTAARDAALPCAVLSAHATASIVAALDLAAVGHL